MSNDSLEQPFDGQIVPTVASNGTAPVQQSETPTPETDRRSFVAGKYFIGDDEVVYSNFARSLERRLTVALRELDEARAALDEPTHAMLKALAGDPLILSASDEAELRARYKAMRAVAHGRTGEGKDG